MVISSVLVWVEMMGFGCMVSRIVYSSLLGLFAVTAGCSFDRNRLGQFAPCESDDQCAVGGCVDGFCIPADRLAYEGRDANADSADASILEDVPTSEDAPHAVDADADVSQVLDTQDETSVDVALDGGSDLTDIQDVSADMPGPDVPDPTDLAELDVVDVTEVGPDATECEPNEPYCDDVGDVRACTPAGMPGEVTDTCDYACSDATCQPNVCGDGFLVTEDGEACDDGNTNACDGCEGCAWRSVGVAGAGTVTNSMVVWTPEGASFTLEAWVMPNADGALFGIGDTTTEDYAIAEIRGGVAVFGFDMGAGRLEVVGSTSLLGSWHHVAFERFDNHGAAVFVDGQLENLVHIEQSSSQIDYSPLIWIGSEGHVTSMTGQIDELRITHGARYREHFTPPRRLDTDEHTLALYHIDTGEGAVVVDSSGNGRDLTLSGWGRTSDSCYGADPGSVSCGDGLLAPWEGCDDDLPTCFACVLENTCVGLIDPSGDCVTLHSSANWENAQTDCSDPSGDLYVVENAIEDDWIVHLVGLDGAYWIGLNDRSSEGTYVWSSGSSASHRNWGDKQPDNWWFSEDCVEINWGDEGRWNDLNCNEQRPYICQSD